MYNSRSFNSFNSMLGGSTRHQVIRLIIHHFGPISRRSTDLEVKSPESKRLSQSSSRCTDLQVAGFRELLESEVASLYLGVRRGNNFLLDSRGPPKDGVCVCIC